MKTNVNLFWSTYDPKIHKTVGDWRPSTARLSSFHALTLLSHVKLGNNVTLYTYQSGFGFDVPKGITVKDASEIFDHDKAFRSLELGHSIAHVSDLVRLRSAVQNNGVILDMDAVMLKPFPDLPGFFGSMPCKRTGGLAPKFGVKNPALTVLDGSWDGKALSMFPMKVSDLMKDKVMELSVRIEDSLFFPPKTGSKAWNFVMWGLKDLAKLDPDTKAFPPMAFCPLPAWMSKGKCFSIETPSRLNGKTELFGHPLPSIREIGKESYCVQHFFESAFQGMKPINDPEFWMSVPFETLLSEEARFVAGKEWEIVLTKACKPND